MSETIYRTIPMTTRAHDDGTVTFIASEPIEDRYRSVIAPPWNLRDYRMNPVVPWGHSYYRPPVGRAEEVSVVDDRLHIRVRFHESDKNPLGQLVAEQVRDGFLNAGSVGIITGKVTSRAELPEDHPHYGQGLLYTDNTLLEFSIVVVPGLQTALAQRGIHPAEREIPAIAEMSEHLEAIGTAMRTIQAQLHNLDTAINPPTPDPLSGVRALLGLEATTQEKS